MFALDRVGCVVERARIATGDFIPVQLSPGSVRDRRARSGETFASPIIFIDRSCRRSGIEDAHVRVDWCKCRNRGFGVDPVVDIRQLIEARPIEFHRPCNGKTVGEARERIGKRGVLECVVAFDRRSSRREIHRVKRMGSIPVMGVKRHLVEYRIIVTPQPLRQRAPLACRHPVEPLRTDRLDPLDLVVSVIGDESDRCAIHDAHAAQMDQRVVEGFVVADDADICSRSRIELCRCGVGQDRNIGAFDPDAFTDASYNVQADHHVLQPAEAQPRAMACGSDPSGDSGTKVRAARHDRAPIGRCPIGQFAKAGAARCQRDVSSELWADKVTRFDHDRSGKTVAHQDRFPVFSLVCADDVGETPSSSDKRGREGYGRIAQFAARRLVQHDLFNTPDMFPKLHRGTGKAKQRIDRRQVGCMEPSEIFDLDARFKVVCAACARRKVIVGPHREGVIGNTRH